MDQTLYKYSQYNIEIETRSSGETFIFNTYSCQGRWIPRSDLDDIKDNPSIDIGDVPIYLAKEQYIVPTTINEYNRLQEEIYNTAHNSKTLHFIIATTKACNYKCYYCFEAKHISNEKMTHETMDDVVNFIIKKCKERPEANDLLLQWFGGEPLLYQEPIRYITSKLKEYTANKKISIRGHITTNGRLFTPDVIDNMVNNYCIKSVQITLDGLPKDYARIKGCSEKDFSTVINNIKYAQDKLDIKIRLNLKDNLQSLKSLIEYIDQEKLRVRVSILHIWDTTQDNSTYHSKYKEYTYNYNQLVQYIMDNSYTYLMGDISKVQRKRMSCKANVDWQYVIDIYGNLYRCVEKITEPKYSIGNIKDGVTNPDMEDLFIENLLYEKCKSCAFLPQCLGKCTMERIIENKGVDCNTVKEFIITYIQRTVHEMM